MIAKLLEARFSRPVAGRFARLLFPVLLSACASGPAEHAVLALSSEQQMFVGAQPAYLQSSYRKLFEEGRRNEVLHRMEIGSLAYKHGEYAVAKPIFDDVIANIESVYADNEAARKARSLWYEESEKDFKGEPYERSMAYFYRGLLYLQDGDYGNARATFLSGLLQDAFAEEEQFSSDFASLVFLAGWAARLDGNERLAAEHFKEYLQYRPDAVLPGPEDNVLIVAETGTAPRKLADGVGHYELVYRRGKNFTDNRASLAVGDVETPLYPAEDLYFQASTRGGRAVDRIIEGKVAFKKSAEAIGSNLTSLSENSAIAGLAAGAGGAFAVGFNAITAIGVAAEGLSARSKTRADTRYWDSLPDTIHLGSIRLAPGAESYTVRFSDQRGVPQPPLSKTALGHFDKNGNGLIFASAH